MPHIKDLCQTLDLTRENTYTYIDRGGQTRTQTDPVLVEHLIDIYINEQLTMKVVCTPQYLVELVLGRLLSEGMIAHIDEVEQLYLCRTGQRAKVLLTDHAKAAARAFVETTPSCCTGNHTLNAGFVRYGGLAPVTPISWDRDWIFALADRFSRGTELHSRTWATHSCFLARGRELLFSCEDIGRHNALDKVIGYGLRHGIPLKECIVYSSGRVPTDMVEKAIRAGIPIFCSKASPTQEAIDLARTHNLTLIGCARQRQMKLYSASGPETGSNSPTGGE